MPFVPTPASDQRPLVIGEQLCDLRFLTVENEPLSLYSNHLFGWPKLILVANSAADAEADIIRLAAQHQAFGQVETHVMGVTRDAVQVNAALSERLGLPFLLLSDPEGVLHSALGMDPNAPPRILFFDPLLRLELDVPATNGDTAEEIALSHVRRRFTARRPVVTAAQAPALMVPNLLDPDHCRRLMRFWEQSRKIEDSTSSKDANVRVNPGSKIRSDAYILLGSAEGDELLAVMRRRLLPEMSKALHFTPTRAEHFRVGCYDAGRGGHFAPHRDNTTPITAHRRYALTLNLNTGDYEGGFLRLPEFGPQLYLPPAGGAIVFSCSLLHLVTPVTNGRRFVLVGFFWGEEDQQVFEASHADMFPEGTDFNLIPG